MNDILRALQAIDSANKKTKLSESAVAECGDMGPTPMPAAQQGNPVTASLTLNASGMDHVADLMRLLQQAGLNSAGPVTSIEPSPAPMAPTALSMEPDVSSTTGMGQLRDKMKGMSEPVSAPKEQYFDVDDMLAGGDDIHHEKEPEDIRIKDNAVSHEIRGNQDIEEYENEPDEKYGDHIDMIKRLSGGLNREKKQYKAAQPGDNAMAAEDKEVSPEVLDQVQRLSTIKDIDTLKKETIKLINNTKMHPKKKNSLLQNTQKSVSVKNLMGLLWNTFVLGKEGLHSIDSNWRSRHESEENNPVEESIKDRLYRALNEKKAKPDFLDVDGDGDKKEPMKKAIKDKKKNPFAKSANEAKKAKPDFLDVDGDGDKKEPMKKAIKDKQTKK